MNYSSSKFCIISLIIFIAIFFHKCGEKKSIFHDFEMKKEKLTLTLSVSPSTLYFSNLKDFQISIAVTNLSKMTINPQLQMTDLNINGEKSMIWMLAICNGIRESKWFSLPPGETTSKSWSTMGEQLFPEPGEYTLQLHLRNISSDSIKITVLKD
ncbi:MAG: hypothetical protein ACKV1O_10785 [Saprospiraceae bacterium]